MKTFIKVCLVTTALSCLSGVSVSAQGIPKNDNALIAQAVALQGQGKSNAAYLILRPAIMTNAQDPEFNYILGLTAADSGHVPEAILAFQRVLAVDPGNAQARAELARTYAMAGDLDTARDQFDTVVNDPSLPDPVRQRFDRIVRNYDKTIKGGGSSVSGFLDVSGGYDSNVNAATDETSIIIPLFAGFGAGNLGAASQEQSDEYVNLQGGVSGVTALSRQTRAFGSVLGTYRDNIGSSRFDQALITGTAGLGRTLANRDVVSGSLQVQQFWLGHDSYRQSYGGILQYTKRLSNGKAFSLSGEYFQQDFESDPLRDSSRYGIGASYTGRSFVLSGSTGHEETKDALADHLSFDFYRVNLGAEKSINTRMSVVVGLGGQIRPYDANDPLFLDKRKDEQLDASLGLKFKITDETYVRPQVTYTRNWSNIALNDYDRVTANIGIRREF